MRHNSGTRETVRRGTKNRIKGQARDGRVAASSELAPALNTPTLPTVPWRGLDFTDLGDLYQSRKQACSATLSSIPHRPTNSEYISSILPDTIKSADARLASGCVGKQRWMMIRIPVSPDLDFLPADRSYRPHQQEAQTDPQLCTVILRSQ